MLTVQRFKELHGLSDTGFKRLVARTAEAHGLTPDDIRARVSGNTWEVKRADLLTAQLTITGGNCGTGTTAVEVLPPLPDFRRQLAVMNSSEGLQPVSNTRKLAERVQATSETLEGLKALAVHVDRFIDWQSEQDQAIREAALNNVDSATALAHALKVKLRIATEMHIESKAETEAAEQVVAVKKRDLATLTELLQSLQSES